MTSGIRKRSRSGRWRVPRASAGRLGSIAASLPSSSSTGSPSRVRRYEPPSPTRSRKRRYSVKQPSAMCWPLSGGGSGSPSRAGQRLHGAAERRPRLVERDLRARRPRARAPRRAPRARRRRPRPSRRSPRATTASFARRREPRLLAEDVEAVRLDPVERLAVQPGERADAERAAPVERVEQAKALGEIRARPLGLERHQLPELRRRLELLDPESRELVLREIDTAELPVLVDVADDVDQLERDAERLARSVSSEP